MKTKKVVTPMLLLMLSICLIYGLTACGGTAKGKSEKQIEDDIAEALLKDAALGEYHLEITSFSVSKRQTNTEDKTDFVWFEVDAIGNLGNNTDHKFSCSIECEAAYGLYNDGWRLDTFSGVVLASSIKPLYYPTQEQAESAAKAMYMGFVPQRVEVHDMIQKSDTEVKYQVDFYYADGTKSEHTVTYKFKLDPQYGGWRYR